MEKILSPITLDANVQEVASIPTSKIIQQYSTELDVDVSSYFKGLIDVKVIECKRTGYRFYFPLNLLGDERFYDALKIKLPEKYNVEYYASWKWEYAIAIDMIQAGESIYEIGCGSGNFLDALVKKGVLQTYGSELNEDSIQAAKAKGHKVEFGTIEEIAEKNNSTYDVVCTFQVLEHVASVHSFLKATIDILKPGGKLIIAVPFNDPYLFQNDIYNTLNLPPHHMGMWNEKVFKNLESIFPIRLSKCVIENLPIEGYDFDRYYETHKDVIVPRWLPAKSILDKVYRRWLKKKHYSKKGKNIIVSFTKNA